MGLPPSATKQEVKAKFRKLVRLHHPDISGGSHENMQRLMAAAEALLKGTAGRPPLARREDPKVRVERQKKQQAEAKREVVLYEGEGRTIKGVWPVYRITVSRIVVEWQLDAYSAWRGITRRQEIAFRDVRGISDISELPEGACDIELRLVAGTFLQLEQLPCLVVTKLQQIVDKEQRAWQARRAKMLHRVVILER